MKNICIIFLLSIIISLTAFGLSGENTQTQTLGKEYLRIHIRADSNENEAQAVKYIVRDKVVDYLTPLVAEYETLEEAAEGLRLRLSEIEKVAEYTLQEKGFSYGATVGLRQEYFPTRVYEDYVLSAGEYTALIIELGAGKGDNWWCVVYPPLCFAATETDVIYKSKIKEIIEAWKKNNETTTPGMR